MNKTVRVTVRVTLTFHQWNRAVRNYFNSIIFLVEMNEPASIR